MASARAARPALPARPKHRFHPGLRGRRAARRPPESAAHILGTSANLLGLCFVVLTSLRILHASGETVIDEVTAVAMVLFMASCLLSFVSIRFEARRTSALLERIADNVFLAGLCLLFVTMMLISFQVVS